jgi:alpha-ketoglutarate-dependent taurine dioxygenase
MYCSSAYEAYDRLSPYYQKFLEGLTAFHSAPFFVEQAKNKGVPVRENRGSPDNKGQHLTNSHPVIRTNPVTGWKGLFVNRGFTKKINELNQDESDHLLEFLFAHIASVSQVDRELSFSRTRLNLFRPYRTTTFKPGSDGSPTTSPSGTTGAPSVSPYTRL